MRAQGEKQERTTLSFDHELGVCYRSGANRPIPSRSWTPVDRAHALSQQSPEDENATGPT